MPESIQITVPETAQPGQAIDVPIDSLNLKSFVPQEYAEKPYFKKYEKFGDFFKAFDEAQSSLGKKPPYAVPAADAPQEEWEKYLAVSRPGKPEDYQFEIDPAMPKEIQASPEIQAKFRQMLYENGVSPRQAKGLQKAWDAFMMDMHKQQVKAAEQMDSQFADLMAKAFGEQAEAKVGRAKTILEKMVPKEYAPAIAALSNEALQIMAIFANSMADKYMKEDEIPGGGGGRSGKTIQEIRTQAMQKLEELRKMDAMNPRKAELSKEIEDLYKEIAKLQPA